MNIESFDLAVIPPITHVTAVETKSEAVHAASFPSIEEASSVASVECTKPKVEADPATYVASLVEPKADTAPAASATSVVEPNAETSPAVSSIVDKKSYADSASAIVDPDAESVASMKTKVGDHTSFSAARVQSKSEAGSSAFTESYAEAGSVNVEAPTGASAATLKLNSTVESYAKTGAAASVTTTIPKVRDLTPALNGSRFPRPRASGYRLHFTFPFHLSGALD